MKHISSFLPKKSEVARIRERTLLVEEVRQRKYLSDMIAIHFADAAFV